MGQTIILIAAITTLMMTAVAFAILFDAWRGLRRISRRVFPEITPLELPDDLKGLGT